MSSQMKTCCKCRVPKPVEMFSKGGKARKDGINPSCKDCNREYYLQNRAAVIARISEWQKNNKDAANAKNAAYRAKHPEKSRQYYLNWKAANPGLKQELSSAWKSANPDKVNALTAKRRAQKLNATPAWANSFFIREAYALAKLRTKITGFEWEVDHQIPLVSPIVCGLHVEHNLQVIPAVINRLKGNKMENYHGS